VSILYCAFFKKSAQKRIMNKYANEQALNNPLIPLETGPHLPPKKGFFRGGYKKKTRRRNKTKRN